MISGLLKKLLMVIFAIGYIPLYLGRGSEGMKRREAEKGSGADLLQSFFMSAAVIFWVVVLVKNIAGENVALWQRAAVYAMPALYLMWCIAVRCKDKKAARQEVICADQADDIHSGAQQSVAFNTVSLHAGTDTALNTGSGQGGFGFEKNTEEENPLTDNFCLGAHHVSGVSGHIGMTVSYRVQTHTVHYEYWSDKDPKREEVFQVPEHVRTKKALKEFVQNGTTIPCVWMY